MTLKEHMNYRCHTGMSLGQGGGRLSLALSGTLLPDPSFSYPREVEIWYEGRGGRELVIKLRPYQPLSHGVTYSNGYKKLCQ